MPSTIVRCSTARTASQVLGVPGSRSPPALEEFVSGVLEGLEVVT